MLLKLNRDWYLKKLSIIIFQFGCVETLTMLSIHYPPTVYLKSWGCFRNFTVSYEKNIFQRSLSMNNSITVVQEHTINNSTDLLNVCVDLLLHSTFGYDFNFHLNLLKFTGNLYSGSNIFFFKFLHLFHPISSNSSEMFSKFETSQRFKSGKY